MWTSDKQYISKIIYYYILMEIIFHKPLFTTVLWVQFYRLIMGEWILEFSYYFIKEVNKEVI